MPLYEFHCQACQQRFSERRPFSEAAAPAECPHCQSRRTRKLLGSAAVIGLSNATRGENIPLSASGNSACGCGACSCGS